MPDAERDGNDGITTLQYIYSECSLEFSLKNGYLYQKNSDLDSASSATSLDLPFYYASTTVIPSADRVIIKAWQTDPENFFRPSDSYVERFFNGPKDILWVGCRNGYTIKDGTSSTGSAVFRMDDASNETFGVAVHGTGRTNITVRCEQLR